MCRQLLSLGVPQHPAQLPTRNLVEGQRRLQEDARDIVDNRISILRGQLDNTYFHGVENPGIYETQTQHGANAGNQARWTAMFAAGLPSPLISFYEILRNNGIRV